MSTLADFAMRRAARIVEARRAACRPSRAKAWVPPAKTLVRRETKSFVVRRVERDPLEVARNVGYATGLMNRHYEDRNFRTGVEWMSWLDGWRAGQREFKQISMEESEYVNREDAELMERFERERILHVS